MLRKILKSIVSNKHSHQRHYSSSDFKRRKSGYHPSKYGHQYYKKKHKSSGFFSSYSS
ncbi:hypothetical protein [Bacillus sp. SA1-12]|uniref:hypothetical protein n=1 Tax=Bacillus sp. SA1-12 TaxID=1455638 RepID=UPI000A4C045A|nr:hypothetical protein [Bacillus sp. SA1-12]